MSETYNCTLCLRGFTAKKALSQHMSWCKWVKESLHETGKICDTFEKRLTDTERDKMLRTLVHEVTTLKKEMISVKQENQKLKRQQRISVLKWLNSTVIPDQTWELWLNSIEITPELLEKALETTLLESISNCLETKIDEKNGVLPLYSFKQRKNILYVYSTNKDETNSWHVCDKKDYIKGVTVISYKLQRAYLQWRNQYIEIIMSNETNQEKDMINTSKIMTIPNKTYQINKVFNIICDSISKDFEETVLSFDTSDESNNVEN
tara:strand:+ start:473 stop:1264 length:792 start_codon:yes stop_codon:yes gene_type:complete